MLDIPLPWSCHSVLALLIGQLVLKATVGLSARLPASQH